MITCKGIIRGVDPDLIFDDFKGQFEVLKKIKQKIIQ